jgi:SAM-dependent methyltransferase
MKMEKTDEEFWEKSWEESKLWRYRKITKYMAVHRRFDKLFKSVLKEGGLKVLEIGCAKGNWLIYFAKRFDYEPYGVDYSEIGCKMAEDNFKRENVNGTILCEDIFKTSLKKESFDVVYSFGLIEHFANPESIINKHIELLKNGGHIIISIPNFKNSLYFTLNKLLGKEKGLMNTHNLNIMDINNFKKLFEGFEGKNVQVQFLDYFGPINLTLAHDSKNKIMLIFMHVLNQILGYLTFSLRSKYFSPDLVMIGKKIK